MADAGLPPGYPHDLERRLTLHDGREVLVRPILSSDAAELATAFEHADRETLYRRFLSPPPVLTARLLQFLTTVDYVRRLALVAVDPLTGTGVAVARFEPVGEDVAEIAVVVTPAWRRVGLATALVELLAGAALDRGVHTFTVTYLAENQPVASLVAATGGGRQRIRSGIAECAIALDRERVTTAVDRLGGEPDRYPADDRANVDQGRPR
jgi:RimJ/RimL family protein N-acetyltransferase